MEIFYNHPLSSFTEKNIIIIYNVIVNRKIHGNGVHVSRGYVAKYGLQIYVLDVGFISSHQKMELS